MNTEREITKGKCIITISVALLLLSIGLQTIKLYDINNYEIKYESIDIKNMAKPAVTSKQDSQTIIDTLINGKQNNGKISEIELPKVEKLKTETQQPVQQTVVQPEKKWFLPTEQGIITQYPTRYHEAYDITSPRGSAEIIYPVANGVISGIYRDNAGALIVTVAHDIDGRKYTSLYAHLSRYADGIYVGKPVSPYDPLGNMGTTGRSTGVHLHLVLADCVMFDSNDPYCSDLNGFFSYAKRRVAEDFYGLGVLVYVPDRWYNR